MDQKFCMACSTKLWYNPSQLQPNVQSSLSLQLQKFIQLHNTGYIFWAYSVLNNFDALANPSAEISREQQGKWTEGRSVSVRPFSLLHRANTLNSVALEINIKPLSSLAGCLVLLAMLLLPKCSNTHGKVAYCFGVGFFWQCFNHGICCSINHLLAGALEPQLSYCRLYDTSWEI